MIIFLTTVFALYFLLTLALLVGWKMVTGYGQNSVAKNNFVSVIVAMRNESANLDKLLTSLKNQTYPEHNFEIILVDDHSDDTPASMAETWKGKLPNLQVLTLNNNENGKKAALSKGIEKAKGDIIATTDADCIVPPYWLEQINRKFQDDHTNLVVGLVAIEPTENLFSQLQALEFASVIGTGVALLGLGYPIMCNGANLSFRKEIFEKVKGYQGNEHIASGDDEFLMRKICDGFPQSVQALCTNDSIVYTKAQPSAHDFIQQRLRWASKWKVNTSFWSKCLALFMLFIQISFLMLIPFVFIHSALSLILIIKLLIDFIFIYSVSRFLKTRFKLLPYFVLQFVYPFYVLYIGIFSQYKTHRWKGRNY
ncbi:MAG: glycosyltransferase [Bacteroidetes bacterium]|nr:glycosyltransferase [Bacteroidota bacterium]